MNEVSRGSLFAPKPLSARRKGRAGLVGNGDEYATGFAITLVARRALERPYFEAQLPLHLNVDMLDYAGISSLRDELGDSPAARRRQHQHTAVFRTSYYDMVFHGCG